jgi:hypothetical protein
MKKILIFFSLYSLLILLFTNFSLYQAIGSRIAISPQMFLVNFIILLPIVIFSILTFFYLRKK